MEHIQQQSVAFPERDALLFRQVDPTQRTGEHRRDTISAEEMLAGCLRRLLGQTIADAAREFLGGGSPVLMHDILYLKTSRRHDGQDSTLRPMLLLRPTARCSCLMI